MANQRHIRDVMTPNPATVSDTDSIRDVARIMKEQDTGVVPVCDGGKKIIGLVTDRDIVVRLIADGKDPMNARVNDVMTNRVRKVREDATVDDVLTLMANSEIRRVPVVNSNDELVGIVSIGDISGQTQEHSRVGEALNEISDARPNH
ncbi:MAG TPA: CBS domain-containing protein [Thermoanaerobaculia bacterium]|jgi:CBS domain-containing protein